MKQVVNDALRRALKPQEPREPYQVTVHESQLQPGLDLSGFNRLADALEDDGICEAARRHA